MTKPAIPTDRVDPERLDRKPAGGGILRSIRRFMLVFGPRQLVVRLPDLLGAVLVAFRAGARALFRTGWFVESLATQTLIIYVIRTPE